MKRIYQTTLVSIALLFCAQAAQAAPMPNATDNFGYVDIGLLQLGDSASANLNLNDDSESVFWFEFTLADVSDVSLDTLGSVDENDGSVLDTILALYNSGGDLLGTQNCDNSVITSCLSFSSLSDGSYIAGVTSPSISAGSVLFAAMWEVGPAPILDIFDETAQLNISVSAPSAIPVPAAFWLFGSALIGFVGVSRRTSVKT
ncbi:hypothetical protein N8198_09140 [Gammaproteobacteria bacterium]|nr:hypothetical protein [Gammaproteobacteria bacterium]